jgi:hypothetical protein
MENKLTQTELDRLKLIREDVLQAVSSLGELEYQKTIVEDQLRQIKENILEIKKKETELVSELNDKYGMVSINLETGEFSK